jgi:hypothetical protein
MLKMAANRFLASERGLDEDTIDEIERIHDLIDKYTRNWVQEPFTQARKDEIHSLEYILQKLWGFPQDCDYHRYADGYEFKCQWVGRTYRCTSTGKTFTIPYEVQERDFFKVGEGFVDVGRLNCYSRFSGVEEVK